MGILTDFFAYPQGEEPPRIDQLYTERPPTLQSKGLDPVKMRTLLEILKLPTPGYDPIEVSESGALLPTHAGLWRALPTADLPLIAATWAQTEECQLSGWSAMDCLHLLASLRSLAEHVRDNDLQVAQATLI